LCVVIVKSKAVRLAAHTLFSAIRLWRFAFHSCILQLVKRVLSGIGFLLKWLQI